MKINKERRSQGEGQGGGCVQRMEVIVKRKKNVWGGGQGRCERRSEAFVKILFIYFFCLFFFFFFFLGGVGSGGGGGGVGGVRVDVNREVKLL